MARDFKDLINDVKEIVTQSARQASVEIMNGLAEAGPGYSGQFSSAWYAVEPGQEPGGPRSAGGSIYKYDLRNVPKARFRSGTYYEIVNGASYAAQALDLEEGVFRTQYDDNGNILDPVKDPTNVGSALVTSVVRLLLVRALQSAPHLWTGTSPTQAAVQCKKT